MFFVWKTGYGKSLEIITTKTTILPMIDINISLQAIGFQRLFLNRVISIVLLIVPVDFYTTQNM